jgi:hypothetical protein
VCEVINNQTWKKGNVKIEFKKARRAEREIAHLNANLASKFRALKFTRQSKEIQAVTNAFLNFFFNSFPSSRTPYFCALILMRGTAAKLALTGGSTSIKEINNNKEETVLYCRQQ